MVDGREWVEGKNTYRNEGEKITLQEEDMKNYFKVKYNSNMFELSIGSNDLYLIMHIMLSKNVKKL